MSDPLFIAVHVAGIFSLMLIASYALMSTYLEKRKMGDAIENVPYFVAAKSTKPITQITYSLISSNIGSLMLNVASSFASSYGYFGILAMALGNSVPALIPAHFGPIIQKYSKGALSLNDYCLTRYGKVGTFYVCLVGLFNLFSNVLAELTIIGQIWEVIVGGNRVFIIIFIVGLTSIYTALGGLSVSIKTDRIQTIFAIILAIIFSIYFAATYHIDSSIPLPDYLGSNVLNGGTILNVTISYAAYASYSESLWQKAWAADNKQNLLKAGWIAFFVTFVIMALFGIFGFAEAWNGDFFSIYNLQLFSIFNNTHPSWILTLLIVLCLIMSESYIDSLQMGMISIISTSLLKTSPLWVTQLSVLIIDVPAIVISLQNLDVTSILLISSLICVVSTPGLFLGFVPALEKYHTAVNLLISSGFGVYFMGLWGANQMNGDYVTGFQYAMYQYFGYEPPVIGLTTSLGVSLLISLIHYVASLIWCRENVKQHAKCPEKIANCEDKESKKIFK